MERQKTTTNPTDSYTFLDGNFEQYEVGREDFNICYILLQPEHFEGMQFPF